MAYKAMFGFTKLCLMLGVHLFSELPSWKKLLENDDFCLYQNTLEIRHQVFFFFLEILMSRGEETSHFKTLKASLLVVI